MGGSRHFDPGSVAVIVITLVLFVVALAVKGFTHDMLLEAGVFLVSVKLIILGYKNSLATESLNRQLEEIRSLLHARGESLPPLPSAIEPAARR